MSSIDNRIVNMQFQNSNFESGIKTSLNSLKTLNESLKMKGATTGLADVDKGIRSLSSGGLAGLGGIIDTVSGRFSALGVIGVTALANITNSAVNAGKNFIKSLTVDPILDGFNEFELKMNSIQTILTNTSSKGTTLDDVNAALEELNEYSDQTIYNFAQMTDNIGKATAAGVGLEDAVTFVKGMSNAAAGFGVDATRMAGATYQMTQALAAGVVKLQDWRSLEQAGMGGEMMQKEMINTAKAMGIFVDESVPFRDSLNDGWLTSEVFIKGMEKMANDPSLTKAATNVTSFTKLLDTMKETVGSGWAVTWEKILGDKEESTALFTSISEGFSKMVKGSTDARNAMLDFWNETGGRSAVLEALSNILKTVGKGLGAVSDAFREVFPPMTGEKLVSISKGFLDLTEKFKMSDKTAGLIKDTFKGLFSLVDLGLGIIKSFSGILSPLAGILGTVAGGVLTVTGSLGRFITSIAEAAKESGVFEAISKTLSGGFKIVDKVLQNLTKGISDVTKGLGSMNFQPVLDIFNAIGRILGGGLDFLITTVGGAIENLDFSHILLAVGALATGKGISAIKDFFGGLGESLEPITGLLDSVGDITGGITDILDGVRGSLEAYQNNLNAGSLLKLAAAVGIMALSFSLLSDIDAASMEVALTGMVGLMTALVASMGALMLIMAKGGIKGFFGLSTAMLAFSGAVAILASALKNLSSLSWDQLLVGLTGLVGIMTSLVVAAKLLSGGTPGLFKTAAGLLVLSFAIKNLVTPVKILSQIDPAKLTTGLVGLGVILGQLAVFLKITDFSKLGITGAAGILIMATALIQLSKAVEMMGGLDANTMIQGLAGVGAMMLQIVIFTKLLGNGKLLISTSVAMIGLALAMQLLAGAVESMGSLSLETIGKGLLAMAGGLAVIGVAAKLIPKVALIGASVGITMMSFALSLLSGALNALGSQSWEGIGKSLVSLAGSLGILIIAMNAMSFGLAGAAAMLVISAALRLFIPQVVALSQLSLAQIGVGLLGLAGAFAILGLASLVLAPLTPAMLGLAGAIALLGGAAMIAGAGVALFAAGFATFAAVGVAGANAIITVFGGLIALIPQLAVSLAQGLVGFITTLATSVPQIITAAGTLISGLLTAFTTAIPQIAAAGVKLVVALANAIGTAVPLLLDAGVKMILAVLKGIADNIGKVTTTAIDIIVNFINTLSANLGRLIQAGIELAISLIEGVANGISQNSGRVSEAFMNLIVAVIGAIGGAIGLFISKGAEAVSKFIQGIMSGIGKALSTGKDLAGKVKDGIGTGISAMINIGKELVNGLISGVKSMASKVVSAAKGVVQGAINGAKKLLGINSPSRVFKGFGINTGEGLAIGLKNSTGMVVESTKNMGNRMIDGMKSSIAKVSDIVNSDMDVNPVIKPVMDLSDIKKDSKTMGSMLDTATTGIKASVSGGISKSIGAVQNGVGNSEIVSALKDLKNSISNTGGNVYNVNGVTYDDGSNISSAVSSLINAARIERRI